ncbi:hypothetical protein EKL30_00640 [Candidimonas sp. SYP-B2681]|uniref:hypothetical protein n=1 Tax=Candidimonas sp. SYP-B2681 TaxID=2497686 RepID=UPI000F86F059|nr:hypothetical protein [Candidimonas sp. SYP-B2681]RTZ47552.1 hypothetical protein EKL30_00640 [Candidimonas sp. SYP-B2681]
MTSVLEMLRRHVARILLVGACSAALAACSTTGNSFDSSALRFIVPGQTTLTEAANLLNSDPTDVYRQLDGSAMARWSHKASMVTDAIYFNQELWLAFGPDGRFQRIVKSENLPLANVYEGGKRVDTLSTGTSTAPVDAAATPGVIHKPAVAYPLPQ